MCFELSGKGNLIRECRKSKNLSQTKLARLLGINQAKLSSWELNKKEIDQKELNKILSFIKQLDSDTIKRLNKRSSIRRKLLKDSANNAIKKPKRVSHLIFLLSTSQNNIAKSNPRTDVLACERINVASAKRKRH